MCRPRRNRTVKPRVTSVSITLLVVVWAMASTERCAAADPDYELTAVLEFGAQFLPDRWVPIRIELTNRSARDVDGSVSMPAGGGASSFIVRQSCRVPARSRIHLTVLASFPDPRAAGELRPTAAGSALSRVDWLSASGERLAMTDVFGTAQSDTPSANAAAASRSLLLLITGEAEGDATAMARPPGSGPFAALAPVWVNVADAPRQRAGYDACRFVVLHAVNPDALDIAQRDALLQHVLAGGVVIVPAPDANTTPTASWLEPYWPVDIIGQRPATTIAGFLKLRAATPLTQAIERTGTIVLRDASYVHAAYQRIGLGRVAFTSFPIGALDPADAKANEAWAEVLGVSEMDTSWEASQLADNHAQHLEEMIGAAAAPWSLAAMIVAGYLATALVVLVTFTGPRRPAGFVALFVIALVGTATLGVLSGMRQRGGLTGARLATLDLAPTGGGIYQEELAFLGLDLPSLTLSIRDRATSLRPVITDAGRPPAIQTDPFAAPNAGVRPATIERIWRSTRAVAPDTRLHATGTFGPDGLALSLDNQLGGTLRAPVLVWSATGAVLRMGDVAPGQTAGLQPGGRNAHGDFSNAEMVASESAKLRGAILRSAATPALSYLNELDLSPIIAGWLDDSALPQALSVSEQASMRTEALVRAPLELQRPAVGTHVAIDGAFVQLVPGPTMGLPYDESRRQWVATAAPGRWVVGFSPPKQVGRLRPKRVTLSCDLAAPQQTVRILGDQIVNANVTPNAAGRVLADWSRPIDRQQIAFEPQPQDVDPNGLVWLMLSVESATAPSGAPQWQIRNLEVAYEAEVVGPLGSDAGEYHDGN